MLAQDARRHQEREFTDDYTLLRRPPGDERPHQSDARRRIGATT